MKKLGITKFHDFMRGQFAKSIEKTYMSYHIFCEADLQSYAWQEITNFVRRNEEKRGKFRVLNQPFLRGLRMFPDLVVFRGKKPWVVIELKESKRLMATDAKAERKKLRGVRKKLHHKRGYLVYVARYGNERVLRGPKGRGNAYHFFEVPIVLELAMRNRRKVQEWAKGFRRWSKHIVPER